MAVNAEAFTEYAAEAQASEIGSSYFKKENLLYPRAYHPNQDLPFEQTEQLDNLYPESDFIRRRNAQLSETEQIPTPEQQLEALKPEKGSKRWALTEIINNHTNFLDKFGRTRTLLYNNFARFLVAAHELGHARVLHHIGGRVDDISIAPKGDVKGYTLGRLPHLRNVIDFCSYRIAVSAGSRITEERIGQHDHKGCGGDNATIRYFAAFGEQVTRGYYKASWFISEGWKIAQRAMSGYSRDELHRDSMSLLHISPATEMDEAA